MLKRENCPLCGERGEIVFSRPYALPVFDQFFSSDELRQAFRDVDYEVCRCARCDIHFQKWVMDDAELARHYQTSDRESIHHAIEQHRLRGFAHQAEEILVLRQVCTKSRPRVLDFGTSWGKWASMAVALGCDVYGVDVDEQAAAFCASRGIRMISLDDLQELTFDFINVDQVAEHLCDPVATVRQLAGALATDGIIKISTPAPKKLPKRLRACEASGDVSVLAQREIDGLYPLVHINLFSNTSLRRLGEECALDVARPPLLTWLGAGQLWNDPHQLNRNFTLPLKRWRGRGTYLWFRPASR